MPYYIATNQIGYASIVSTATTSANIVNATLNTITPITLTTSINWTPCVFDTQGFTSNSIQNTVVFLPYFSASSSVFNIYRSGAVGSYSLGATGNWNFTEVNAYANSTNGANTNCPNFVIGFNSAVAGPAIVIHDSTTATLYPKPLTLPTSLTDGIFLCTQKYLLCFDTDANRIFTTPFPAFVASINGVNNNNALTPTWTEVTSNFSKYLSIVNIATWNANSTTFTFGDYSHNLYFTPDCEVFVKAGNNVFSVLDNSLYAYTEFGYITRSNTNNKYGYIDCNTGAYKDLLTQYDTFSMIRNLSIEVAPGNVNITRNNNVLISSIFRTIYLPYNPTPILTKYSVDNTTNANITCASNFFVHNPGSTRSAQTYNLPPSPFDGQEQSITCLYAVTSLTITAAAPPNGVSILTFPTSLTANQTIKFKYFISTNTWYRIS